MKETKSVITMDDLPDIDVPGELTWEGGFIDYVNKCVEHPLTVRTAHQRLADALMSYKYEEYTFLRERVIRYKVFDDPFTPDHKNAIYGRNVDISLMKLMRILKAAANQLGQEWRMYLTRGPVGTAKSTLASLAALALEDYTKKPEGQLFSPFWVVEDDDEEGMEILGTLTRKFERTRFDCPLHEEPLRILPLYARPEILKFLNGQVLAKDIKSTFFLEGEACPICFSIFRKLMRRYGHNWKKVVENHLRVRRYVLSKSAREGIVTTRPKSEKDQDAAEFLGNPNYANLGAFGTKTDPRTFDFAGHFMAANRGLLNYEEQLKFALQFLYDCLGATQEHRVQPSSFMEVCIDVVILGSTNEPEYQDLKKNDKMEALRDRMIVVDIPYILKLSDEVKIYQKFFGPEKRGGKHLAPRTLYLASYWAILTRIEESKKGIKLRDKLKLYDGRQVEGFTEDTIRDFKKESEREGMDGISPRYIHDKISAAFMREDDKSCVNFFTVFNELSEGLPHHQQFKSDEARKRLENLIMLAREELEERLEEDIQDAATGGEEDLVELFNRYIDQTMAYKMHEKVRNPVTEEMEDADEEFMRSIENKIGISDYADFRQKIINQMQKRALERGRDPSKPAFDFRTDERLYRALRMFLFDQVRERINWERLVSRKITGDNVAGNLTEAERLIDKIKTRLKEEKYGPENESYCDVCAAEALVYYASVFVRRKKKK